MHVLSARRPHREPTPAEREEGIFKYHPYLELAGPWTLSHQRELLGIRDIVVSPTSMESTSLVFAFGDLDIFGTRVAPIGTFDVLGKGFGKLQLIGTVLATAIGTAVLAPMVSFLLLRLTVHANHAPGTEKANRWNMEIVEYVDEVA
jgi:hypothetical protein